MINRKPKTYRKQRSMLTAEQLRQCMMRTMCLYSVDPRIIRHIGYMCGWR